MDDNKKQNFAATSVSIVVFLLFFLGLKWNMVVASLLSVGTWFGVYNLSKPVLKLGNTDIEALENAQEIKELMEEAHRDMTMYKNHLDQVKAPEIKEEGEKLYATGKSILDYLEDNPRKISKARRFLNYYLETSKELIVKYVSFEKTNIKTEELVRIYESTLKALNILQEAFRKQFVKLASNEILDIESDIQLLEKTLKEEG